MKIIRTDTYGVPRVFEAPYIGYPTIAEAVEAYIAQMKQERQSVLAQINRRMSRLESFERKIRMARKLGN